MSPNQVKDCIYGILCISQNKGEIPVAPYKVRYRSRATDRQSVWVESPVPLTSEQQHKIEDFCGTATRAANRYCATWSVGRVQVVVGGVQTP